MKAILRNIVLVFLLLNSRMLLSQNMDLRVTGPDVAAFLGQTNLKPNYPNLLLLNNDLQTQLQLLRKLGYLSAAIDSFGVTGNQVTVKVFLGKMYSWATINTSNILPELILLSGYNEKEFYNKALQPNAFSKVIERMLRYYENNGYPFASAQLDSLSFREQMVSGRLFVDKGPFIKIDTITLNEEAGINKRYLEHYLGIHQGDVYNEKKIAAMSQRLKELNFLSEAYPWKVNFRMDKTTLNWYIKERSANRADVLIGLLPNNAEIGNKFLLTGDVKFAFINALEQGEKLEFTWQNLQYQSPRLNIMASYPYLLNTQIGITGTFDYYKKDTTFRTVSAELGFNYQFSAQEEIKAYYQTGSSRLIAINKGQLLSTKKLPENADIRNRTFGLEGQLNHVDYKLNPRKGWQSLLNGSVAIREFLKNSDIENTYDPSRGETFAYLYDSLQIRSYRFQIKGHLGYYYPLSKRMVLHARYQTGIMQSKKTLYRNELFQIGGFRLLRGFDEGSLFVNNYHLITLEPRFLLSQNSYLFLFSDLARIKRNYPGIDQVNTPYSLGMGMVFETKAGLFNMSYAIGSMGNRGIELRNSKIHFGYVNYF